MRDLCGLAVLIYCVVALTLVGVVGCGEDKGGPPATSYCDHGNRIYPNGVAANDPSCPR